MVRFADGQVEGGRVNAREVMQALLDGQTVESVYGKFKLEPNGEILHFYVNDEEWDVADMIFNDIRAEFKIVEEYPLTFKEAMAEMLKGKKVKAEICENVESESEYYFGEDGTLKSYHPEEGECTIIKMTFHEKWKVVE